MLKKRKEEAKSQRTSSTREKHEEKTPNKFIKLVILQSKIFIARHYREIPGTCFAHDIARSIARNLQGLAYASSEASALCIVGLTSTILCTSDGEAKDLSLLSQGTD